MTFNRPPATEEQLRLTEEQLGHPLPPLLRLLYSEVANGGAGLIWYDEQFPLIGALGGYPSPSVRKSKDGESFGESTIERLVSRSCWRLHHCIEAALSQHPERYVVCSTFPDGFVSITDVRSQGYELDLVTGYVYDAWLQGDLPLDDNQSELLHGLSFYRSSLEEVVEEYLAHAGCGAAAARRESRPPTEHGELTPDQLDPACQADAAVAWRGLYRGVEEIINPREPDDDAW